MAVGSVGKGLIPGFLKPTETASAPLLRAHPEREVVPPAILSMPALERHLWYFNVADQLGKRPVSEISLPAGDHTLSFNDLRVGLKKLGMGEVPADMLATGVLVDRGGRQVLKGEGSLFGIDISPRRSGSTGHPDVARSRVYDEAGNVDEAKLDAFFRLLDPGASGKVTMEQFKSAASQLMRERIPDDGLLAGVKRWGAEGTFTRAWSSFMKLAGHEDASGAKYVTRDDIRWFFDGTYFFRKALEREGAPESRGAKGADDVFER